MIGRRLSHARRRAGLTQRELAARAGVPQSTVARIELGMMDPRVGTVDRLLRECGMNLELEPRLGEGVDRSQIVELRKLTPKQRVEHMAAASRGMAPVRGVLRRQKAAG